MSGTTIDFMMENKFTFTQLFKKALSKWQPVTEASVLFLCIHSFFPLSHLSSLYSCDVLLVFFHFPNLLLFYTQKFALSRSITATQMRRDLGRVHTGQAPRHDGFTSRVLKACVSQLVELLQHLYSPYLSLKRVSPWWKLCPSAQEKTCLNKSSRLESPSHIMKTLERLSLRRHRSLVKESLLPLFVTHLSSDLFFL